MTKSYMYKWPVFLLLKFIYEYRGVNGLEDTVYFYELSLYPQTFLSNSGKAYKVLALFCSNISFISYKYIIN